MKKIISLSFIVTLFVTASILYSSNLNRTNGGNKKISSFSKSKKILLKKIYKDRKITLYCGCKYSIKKKIDWDSCGFKPYKDKKRAKRLEWEHVVPAHAFGKSFKEWREGDIKCVNRKGKKFKGRKCATKLNKLFKFMQADMYNLYPAIGEVNGRRSNYSMAIIEGESRHFGKCDVEISNRKIEPRPEIRGNIARTYFYMELVYPNRGIISRKNRKLFSAWNKSDPVDRWECERARRIEKIQKNRNQILYKACQSAGF